MVEYTGALVVGHCLCASPDPVDINGSGMPPWCGNCGVDLDRYTIEALKQREQDQRDAQEADAKDLLHSLGAP